jgi:hypothetical protein
VSVRYAPPRRGLSPAPPFLPATATGEPLRRTLLATLALALTLPATAVGAEEGAHSATEEDVTLVMMLLIGALIALGLVIVAIESKRGK